MYETNLTGALQKLIQETVKGMKPADMMTGIVLSVEPLSVQPDISMPPIPEAALTLTETVKERTVTASVQGGDGGSVTIPVREALKAGDKVLMLRVHSGQNYIILSKL